MIKEEFEYIEMPNMWEEKVKVKSVEYGEDNIRRREKDIKKL